MVTTKRLTTTLHFARSDQCVTRQNTRNSILHKNKRTGTQPDLLTPTNHTIVGDTHTHNHTHTRTRRQNPPKQDTSTTTHSLTHSFTRSSSSSKGKHNKDKHKLELGPKLERKNRISTMNPDRCYAPPPPSCAAIPSSGNRNRDTIATGGSNIGSVSDSMDSALTEHPNSLNQLLQHGRQHQHQQYLDQQGWLPMMLHASPPMPLSASTASQMECSDLDSGMESDNEPARAGSHSRRIASVISDVLEMTRMDDLEQIFMPSEVARSNSSSSSVIAARSVGSIALPFTPTRRRQTQRCSSHNEHDDVTKSPSNSKQ